MNQDEWGAALFRHRGWVPVLPIALALVFGQPTRVTLAVGVAVMVVGEILRLWAASHLGPRTRSSRPVASGLVTTGPFAHTRHPLYAANLLLTVGFCVASGAFWPWLPLIAATGFLALYAGHASREEAVLAVAFPEEHRAYAARVPRLGWRFRASDLPSAGAVDRPSLRRGLDVELLTIHAEAWLVAALALRGRFTG